MVGDNIDINIELKKSQQLDSLHEWLKQRFEYAFSSSDISFEEITDNHKHEHDPKILEKILIGFENDFDVPASFCVSYYELFNKGEFDIISIGAFNHPAGEFLSKKGIYICQLLSESFVKKIVLTNDSEFSAIEIMEKFTNGNEDSLGVIFSIP